MVISVVEIEVRGKFICLQSMREEILEKKKKKKKNGNFSAAM